MMDKPDSKRRPAGNKKPRRSTGPLSPAGKARVSRNAIQHGLAIPIVLDREMGGQSEQLARLIARDTSNPSHTDQAREIVASAVELVRVSAARTALLERKITEQEVPTEPDQRKSGAYFEACAVMAALPALAAIERYERRALSRMRRTVQRFRYCEWLNRKN
jgi:hypothetical protein